MLDDRVVVQRSRPPRSERTSCARCGGGSRDCTSGRRTRRRTGNTSTIWSQRRSRGSRGARTMRCSSSSRRSRTPAEHEFWQNEALAHELCGRFHAGCGEKRLAAMHLSAAMEGYAQWGAAAKVEQLQHEFALLADPATHAVGGKLGTAPGLDYLSLLKVSEALTGELNRDRLLTKMTRLCGEAASAERAVLILDEGGLGVRARAAASGEVQLERTPLAASPDLPACYRRERVPLGADDGARPRGPRDGARRRSVLRGARDRFFARGADATPTACSTSRTTWPRTRSLRIESKCSGCSRRPCRSRCKTAFCSKSASAPRQGCGCSPTRVRRSANRFDFELTLAKVAQLAVPALADWCVVDLFDKGVLRPVAYAHANPRASSPGQTAARTLPRRPLIVQPQVQALHSGKPVLMAGDSRAACRRAHARSAPPRRSSRPWARARAWRFRSPPEGGRSGHHDLRIGAAEETLRPGRCDHDAGAGSPHRLGYRQRRSVPGRARGHPSRGGASRNRLSRAAHAADLAQPRCAGVAERHGDLDASQPRVGSGDGGPTD